MSVFIATVPFSSVVTAVSVKVSSSTGSVSLAITSLLVVAASSATSNVSGNTTGRSFTEVTVTVKVPVAEFVPSETVYVIVSIPL